VALIRPPRFVAEMGITHYVILWSPDFPAATESMAANHILPAPLDELFI